MISPGNKSEENFASLEKLMAARDVIAFVGSGLSVDVYPDWRELVGRLSKACGLEMEEEIPDSTPVDLMVICDLAKEKDPAAYFRALSEIFDRKTTGRNAYDYLVTANYSNYVTTNFDCLLADQLTRHADNRGISEPVVYTFPLCDTRFLRQKKTVSYLHGYIRPGNVEADARAVVLSEKDFEIAYGMESKLPTLLKVLFTEFPVCFVGCQLQEIPLQRTFHEAQGIRSRLRREFNQSGQEMFILLEDWGIPADGCEPMTLTRVRGVYETTTIQIRSRDEETAYYEDLGIKVVRYPRLPYHKGLDDVLRRLARISEPRIYEPKSEVSFYER